MRLAFATYLRKTFISNTLNSSPLPAPSGNVCKSIANELTTRNYCVLDDKGKGDEALHMRRLAKLQLLRLRLKMLRDGKAKEKLKEEIRQIETEIKANPQKKK